MAHYEVKVPVEIDAIKSTTERGVWAMVKSTGKLAYLPRSCTQFRNQTAFISQWFFDKMCRKPQAL